MLFKKLLFFELCSGLVDMLLFIVKMIDFDVLCIELVKCFEVIFEFFVDDVVVIDVCCLVDGECVVFVDICQMLNDVWMCLVGVVVLVMQGWVGEVGLLLLEVCDCCVLVVKFVDEVELVVVLVVEVVVVLVVVVVFEQLLDFVLMFLQVGGQMLVIDWLLCLGQQIYVKGDFVVFVLVSYGVEIIVEGNIYIYVLLCGCVFVGVYGNYDVCIFCMCFELELILIVGIY